MKKKKVLFVATNTVHLGDTGHRTGAFLSELTHPFEEISAADYEIDIGSPLGGEVPLDGIKMDDPVNAVWMNDEGFLDKIQNTRPLHTLRSEDYCAIFIVGGHGAMFDLPDSSDLQQLVSEIYENDGVIAAVCHGTAGLVNCRSTQGNFILSAHEVTGFSNAEEEIVGMENVVPFLLQNKIESVGATYTCGPKFAAHVVKSGRVVTGQNPASSMGVGQSIVEVLEFLEMGLAVPEVNWCEWHAQL